MEWAIHSELKLLSGFPLHELTNPELGFANYYMELR
jgi:hypothetical protein